MKYIAHTIMAFGILFVLGAAVKWLTAMSNTDVDAQFASALSVVAAEWWLAVGLTLTGVGGILDQVTEQTEILRKRDRDDGPPRAATAADISRTGYNGGDEDFSDQSADDKAAAIARMASAAAKPTRPYQVKGFDRQGGALERIIEAESSQMAKYAAQQEGMKKVVHVARA